MSKKNGLNSKSLSKSGAISNATSRPDSTSEPEPASKTYPTREKHLCLLLDKDDLIRIREASDRIMADAKLIQELLPDEEGPLMMAFK